MFPPPVMQTLYLLNVYSFVDLLDQVFLSFFQFRVSKIRAHFAILLIELEYYSVDFAMNLFQPNISLVQLASVLFQHLLFRIFLGFYHFRLELCQEWIVFFHVEFASYSLCFVIVPILVSTFLIRNLHCLFQFVILLFVIEFFHILLVKLLFRIEHFPI